MTCSMYNGYGTLSTKLAALKLKTQHSAATKDDHKHKLLSSSFIIFHQVSTILSFAKLSTIAGNDQSPHAGILEISISVRCFFEVVRPWNSKDKLLSCCLPHLNNCILTSFEFVSLVKCTFCDAKYLPTLTAFPIIRFSFTPSSTWRPAKANTLSQSVFQGCLQRSNAVWNLFQSDFSWSVPRECHSQPRLCLLKRHW